ncbi:hypothetical protein [Micromonospora echinospora]|uniref:hypothetical protein n=1 Tax=Micromonospora echinospora TaxID=1877 RepID=UPI00117F605B|nr:hypothetical protein [Micromonospora echinospora]
MTDWEHQPAPGPTPWLIGGVAACFSAALLFFIPDLADLAILATSLAILGAAFLLTGLAIALQK